MWYVGGIDISLNVQFVKFKEMEIQIWSFMELHISAFISVKGKYQEILQLYKFGYYFMALEITY